MYYFYLLYPQFGTRKLSGEYFRFGLPATTVYDIIINNTIKSFGTSVKYV
jgi:hypothetical protein